MPNNNPSHSAEELRDAHSPLHNEVNELAGAVGGMHLSAQVAQAPEPVQINHGFQLITHDVSQLFYDAQSYTLAMDDYQSFFAVEVLYNKIYELNTRLTDIALAVPPHGDGMFGDELHLSRALTINEAAVIHGVIDMTNVCLDIFTTLPADYNYNVSFAVIRGRLAKIKTGCFEAIQRNFQPMSMVYRLHLDQII